MCGQWFEYLYLDKDVGGEPCHGACTPRRRSFLKKVVRFRARMGHSNWESANNQNWVLNKT